MTRALLLRNLRHQRRLLAAVAAGLAGLELLLIWIGAQIESGPGFRALFEMMPPMFREALAAQLSLVSFAAVVALGFQHPVVLAAAVALAIVAATIPAGERETGLLDLILARPLSRARYLAATLAGVAACAALPPASLMAGAAAGLSLVEAPGELPLARYLPCAIGLFALLLAVGGCATLIGAGAARRGPAAAQAAGLTLVAYIVEVLADLWSGLEPIRWASPFHYFKPIPSAVIPATPLENPLVLLGISAVATGLAFARFGARDI